jgi:hypothetical protein
MVQLSGKMLRWQGGGGVGTPDVIVDNNIYGECVGKGNEASLKGAWRMSGEWSVINASILRMQYLTHDICGISVRITDGGVKNVVVKQKCEARTALQQTLQNGRQRLSHDTRPSAIVRRGSRREGCAWATDDLGAH